MGARPSTFAKPVEAPKPTREWSVQQDRIFQWFQRTLDISVGNCQNLVVRARAGTGKTTTIIEGVNRAPEPSILVCAFNKGIAEELTARVENPHAEVKTLHALGYQMIRREWRGMPVAKDGLRAQSLTDTVIKGWEQEHKATGKVPEQIRRLVGYLHTKGREMCPLDPTDKDIEALAYRFDYVPDEGWGVYDLDWVVTHALMAMHEAATVNPTYDIGIDFADMLYLPLTWNLTARDWQLVVVDEAQDMTVAQLELCQRCCGGRFCIVGDDRQAIYGFRGADSGSLDRLKQELQAEELPLTVTYRCGRTSVEKAQELVPDIEAHPNAPDGSVVTVDYADMLRDVQPGDFILSRLNAPLVGIVLKLLRRQKRATMRGRDLGDGILKVLKRLRCFDSTPIEAVIEKVLLWERQTVTKLAASGQHQQIERVRDQAGILYALAEDAETTSELLRKAQYLFADVDGTDVILGSSVHKAKGLEANRVYVLRDSLCRFGDTEEELNICYVAYTRAKTQLVLVTSVPGLAPRLQRD